MLKRLIFFIIERASLLMLFIVFVFLFSVPLGASLSDFNKFSKPSFRVFLLSNQDYKGKDLDLRYAANDMLVFKKIFQNVFAVPDSKISLHRNLTISEFLSATKAFSSQIQDDELVVIVYAGHGNVNGMPIFADRQTIPPSKFFSFINSFSNDTLLIMDSCYSGAEGSSVLTADEVDSATMGLPELVISKDVKEGLGYRSNILRIYSSLAHQQSREAKYKGVKSLSKHLDKTYSFLEGLGYDGSGNGIFSIIFASFFAELDFSRSNYTYDSLNSYINLKVSALKESGYSSQRPKVVPIGSPFKSRESYYILYKDFAKASLSETEKKYIQGVVKQSKGDYKGALSSYEAIYEEDNSYKDIKSRISESYLGLAQAYEDKDMGNYLFLLGKALEYNPNSLFVLSSLGRAYLSSSSYEKSLGIFSKLLKLSISYNDYFFISNAYNNIGFIYYTRGSFSSALEHFELALQTSKKTNDFSGQSVANNYIGALYLKIGDEDKALLYFGETKRISELSGDKFSLASAINNIALIQVSKDKYKDALANFLKVISHFKSLSARNELVICQNNIAFTYTKLEQYDKALKYYNSSLKFYRDNDDRIGEVDSILNISDIYSTQGNYKSSLKSLLGLEKIVYDDVYNTVRLSIAQALSYIGVKKYKTAIDLLNNAKLLSSQNGYSELEISASIELSLLYESLIKDSISEESYKDALVYLEKVLMIYKGLDSIDSLIGQTYASMGYVYYKQGLYAKALLFLEKALLLTGRNVDVKKSVLSYMVNILLAMGIEFADEQDYAKAFEYFNRSLEISRSLKDHRNAAKTALTIANFYEKIKQEKKALNYYKIALDLFIKSNDLIQVADIYHRIGLYYNSSKEYEKAYDNFKQAFMYVDGYEDKPLYSTISRDLVYSTNLLASSFYGEKRYKLASIYYKEAFSFLEASGNGKDNYKDVLASTLKGLSLAYWNIDRHDDAILYQKKLILLLKKNNSPDLREEEAVLKIMLGNTK